MLRLRLLGALALVMSVAAPSMAQPQAVSPEIVYTVAKGDDLYTLATRYFARTESYSVVQRLNHIRDPYRLQIGSRIRIPRALLRKERIEAVVQSYRGNVRIQNGGVPAGVQVGMVLGEGGLITTGPNAFLTLRLPDDSVVAIPSQSVVQIRQLRRTLLAGTIDRQFSIMAGRASAIVSPMSDPASSFEISTPVAVSAVRGTTFRMSYAAASERATTEVLDGKVVFSPESRSAAPAGQVVGAGFGSASNLQQPVALLPAPDLLSPGQVQDDPQLHFTLKPAEGAVRYRFQIALDAGFLNMIDEAETQSPSVSLEPVANGSYFIRATAIDENGLEGIPSTYGFERRLNRIEANVDSSRVGRYRQYLFRWRTPDAVDAQYRFQMISSAEGAAPVVDEAGLKTTSFIVTDLPDGVYRWRVLTLEIVGGRRYEKWTPFQELRVSSEK